MPTKRRYKKPIGAVQKMRAMRAINGVRYCLLRAAIEAEEYNIEHDPEGQQKFVHRHRKVQEDLAGHFPFIDIRGDAYASDIASALARDVTYFILHGDTPGTAR